MPTVVLCIKKPSNLLRGVLRGALLEVQAGIFIGTLDAKLITHLHQIINESLCTATLCVTHSKSPTGHRIKVFGDPHRYITELDGVQLVARKKSFISKS